MRPASLRACIRGHLGFHHAGCERRVVQKSLEGNAAFVGDEVTDRFCVLGDVTEHVAKLQELADAGVDQFNIYLMNGDEEQTLEVYGREIIPQLAAVAGS